MKNIHETETCEYCDGTVQTVLDVVPFNSKAVHSLYVPGVRQFKCSKCSNVLIPLTEMDKITKYVKEKEQQAIDRLPIGDFVSLNEAAEILGVSKQAFNKNSRIKRGFIYSTIKDGRTFYYRKSVEEFKRTGKDGRISLMVSSSEIRRAQILPFVSKRPGNTIASHKYTASAQKLISVPDKFLDLQMTHKHKKYVVCC